VTQLRAVTDTIRDIVDMRSELDAVRESRDRFEAELREFRRERPDLPSDFAYMAQPNYPGAEPSLVSVVKTAMEALDDPYMNEKGLDVLISRLVYTLADARRARDTAVGKAQLAEKQLKEANDAIAEASKEVGRAREEVKLLSESNATLANALGNRVDEAEQLSAQIAGLKKRRRKP
jgi:Cdc6-like AAA superfamily ATPase